MPNGLRRSSPLLLVPAVVLLVVVVQAMERSSDRPPTAVEAVDQPSVDPRAPTAAGNAAEPQLRRSTGPAGGYVADSACALCHTDLYESYQEVGMARSFHRPSSWPAIEDFDQPAFHHAPSNRWYQMLRRGERIVMRRYQLAEDGQPINVLEQPVDWILGSGHTSRSYLYQTAWGELYQLPLAWYTQSGTWGMAPGYDDATHQGTLRRVRRDCMFCHNAYPDVPAGADDFAAPQTYPAQLPEGIGCQRCHGPGAEHIDKVFAGAGPAAVRAAVVEPSRLGGERMMDVCMQCHLQPSVALSGVRRFGRDDYSFRPGEPLSEHLAPLDVVESRPRGERFEINHHAYRLLQSPCAGGVVGRLTCLNCHDPHRKVAPSAARAHYRAACLECHEVEQCGARTASEAGTAVGAGHEQGVDLENCVSCHMPRRRTQDVVGVVMTDHRIGRPPQDPESLLEPLAERSPVVHGVEFLFPEAAGPPQEAEVYRALAMVRGGSTTSLDRLARSLTDSGENAVEPALALAQGLWQAGRTADAIRTLEPLLARHPDHPLVRLRLGVALAASGRLDEARGHLERVLELEPESPEALYNLGKAAMLEADFPVAEDHFRRALALRPNMVEGRFDLGVVLALQGRLEEAASELTATLALDPRHDKAYLNLGRALALLGRPAEARRVWRHGLDQVEDRGPLETALRQLDGG